MINNKNYFKNKYMAKTKYSSCCSAEMKGNSLVLGVCPNCLNDCAIVEDDMEEENPEKLLTPLQAEEVLAEIIDLVYLDMKDNFVNYAEKTHRLGFFKEHVKALYNQKMEIYKLTGKLNF